MKVGFINTQYQLGGAETVMQQVHFGLLNRGHSSTIHVGTPRGSDDKKYVKSLTPRFIERLRATRFKPFIDRKFPKLEITDRNFRKIANLDYDIIHIHGFYEDYATIESLAELAQKRTVIWTLHKFWAITGGCEHPFDCNRYLDKCGSCPRVGEWPIGKTDRTAKKLRKKIEHWRNAGLNIISPSTHLARAVKASQVGKNWSVYRIFNGIEGTQFKFQRKRDSSFRQRLNLSEDKTTVLVTNHNFQNPIKGFNYIREALNSIEPCNIQVILVGNNSAWAAAELPDWMDVYDAGYVSDREYMADLHEAADIYLFASPGENFPCSILEAMSSECCILSTPTDSSFEQLEHGKSGFISEEMSGLSLASELSKVAENIELQRKVGTQARLSVEERFSERQMIDDHIRLYEALLSGKDVDDLKIDLEK